MDMTSPVRGSWVDRGNVDGSDPADVDRNRPRQYNRNDWIGQLVWFQYRGIRSIDGTT